MRHPPRTATRPGWSARAATAAMMLCCLGAVSAFGGSAWATEAAPAPSEVATLLPDGVLQSLPHARASAPMADLPHVLILSGDGGWGEVERNLAEDFLNKGMAVTGVDSRKTFDRRRDLAEVVAFIEGLVSREQRLVIVGYSFGADLLPVIWPHLSQALKRKTLRVAMIAPTHEGSLSIDPTGRYDGQQIEIFPLKDTIGHAPHRRLVCIYGAEEKQSGYSSCPNPGFDPARRIELPGGHNVKRSTAQIAAAIAEEMEERREAAAP